MNAREQAIAYLEDNTDLFNDLCEALDGWNGFLGDNRVEDMEFLNDIYSGTDPLEILYRAFYGYDADNWTTDEHGEKRNAEFNPNRDYFYFNGYGNLVSTDYRDYTDKYDAETVLNAVIDERDNIDIDNSDFEELLDLIAEEDTEADE